MKTKGNKTYWLVGAGLNLKGERVTLSASLGENENYIRNKILKEKDNYAILVIERWYGVPVQPHQHEPAVLADVKPIWYANESYRTIFDRFYKDKEQKSNSD